MVEDFVLDRPSLVIRITERKVGEGREGGSDVKPITDYKAVDSL